MIQIIGIVRMSYDSLKLAYTLLRDQTCEYCQSTFNFNNIKIEQSQSADFETSYQCPDCESEFAILFNIHCKVVEANILDGEKNRIETKRSPRKALLQNGHSAKKLVDNIHGLKNSLDILLKNFDVINHYEDTFPDRFEQDYGRSMRSVEDKMPNEELIIDVQNISSLSDIHTSLHNYLSSAYTFDQMFENIRPYLEWEQEVSREFQDYNECKNVVIGLRHYIQHESIIPLSFKLNKTASERESDMLTDLSAVRVMESQIQPDQPDGYKEGADTYYSDIEDDKINISDRIAKHAKISTILSKQVIESTLEVHREKIEEYEAYEDEFFDTVDLNFSDLLPDN